MNNINSIRQDCAACGACSIICPKSCIDFFFDSGKGHFAVSVDERICIACGKCRKVCPILSSTIHERESTLGNTISAYAAHSKDKDIRKYAASGGFITSFLCFLLNTNRCEGVLISHRKGLTGESRIVTSTEGVIASKTSIYAPVDYANGIQDLLNTHCKKIVVVGLPCQIQAISNLEKINRIVAEKIILKISIVCGKTPTTHAYRYIAKVVGFDYESITEVCNRGDGWPGFLKITHSKGKFKTPYEAFLSMGTVLSSPYMCNRGCLSCMDGVGLSADMVVSDAWTKKYTCQKSDGWNYVLTKSDIAEALLREKELEKYIHIESEEIENFYKANKRVIDKGVIGNAMRLKEHKMNYSFSAIMLKYRIHFVLLKTTIMLFNPLRITRLQLVIGKLINKLKD